MTTEMTELKRLIDALKREPVDRPPCICPGGMMNMIVEDVMDLTNRTWPEAHIDGEAMAELAAGQPENGGFENYGVPFCMTVEAEAMGAPVSMGDRIHEPRVTGYVMSNSGDMGSLKEMDLSSGRTAQVCRAISLLKKRNGDIPVIANLTGPISLATSLVDPSLFYKDMKKSPEKVQILMDFVVEQLVRFGMAQIEAGADVLTISDPSGTGEILGPKAFERWAIPALNGILDRLSPSVKGTIVHICGRLGGVAHLLDDIRSDCISFDSITSAKELALRLSTKSLMGNVSTLAIETASPEHLKRMAKVCMDHGIDILSPACGIGAGTALSQVRTLVDSAKERKSS
ncbi:methylcobamide--CoM methyltransferase [Dethiosulfovibrio sp. F2B]|uniref:uroporphyrinogen decarboxylase family protein n=1 Tax=Dethiosulfovibrio faecalis TaxID=2720018 RepID=UPI001F3C1177|nr:uroporphyrinogen decarboxylase family protein [Dethiosulfovibrio faecalis]MCF4152353.1 methylcobamide--CoM methyltransferase [Dethiosulfovibrio faecalis]